MTGSIASAPNVLETATSVTVAGVAPGIAAGCRDLLAHGGNAFRSIHGFHLVNACMKRFKF